MHVLHIHQPNVHKQNDHPLTTSSTRLWSAGVISRTQQPPYGASKNQLLQLVRAKYLHFADPPKILAAAIHQKYSVCT